jgi:membrane peptidoglycan carboxypeptidase
MLSWPQAALLAGLMPAPSAYNPVTNFAAARAREAHVLDRLAATGALTQAQADRAYHQRLFLTHSQRARTRCLTSEPPRAATTALWGSKRGIGG